MPATPAGRPNQRLRTRADLLRAAARLVADGQLPSLDAIAEAAHVSRATAYRYFPSAEAVLAEAAVEIAMPDAATLFAGDADSDPVARLATVDSAVNATIIANEAALRIMLSTLLQFRLKAPADVPARQNRRTPLIAAALAPAAARFTPAALDRLTKALGLIIGPEAMIAFKDVLGVDEPEATQIRRWMIAALVAAASDDAAAPAASPQTKG